MKKKAKIILWIFGLFAMVLIILVSISLFSTNQRVKYVNWKIMLFFMSFKDTGWINPEGRFQSVRIVYIDPYSKEKNISFTVPADKIEQFEKGYREAIRTAQKPYEWNINLWKMYRLEITTEKKTYKVFFEWTNEKVLFENGMESSDLRKVFFDVGLGEPSTGRDEKTNEGPQ
jgi:hypothetical protein